MNHPLDPELLEHLKGLAEKAASEPEPSLEDGRIAYRAGYRASGPQPETDIETRDIALSTGASMRLYIPQNQTSEALVLYAHGGGFAVGDVETYDLQSRWLAEQTGQRIVSLDYRLSPEHIFPAPVEDSIAAFDLIQSMGLATADQIILSGDSAGGCLCLVTALHAVKSGLTPARVVSLYPVTDFTVPHPDKPLIGSLKEFAKGYYLESDEMLWFRGQYTPDRSISRDWRVSPMFADDIEKLPATWIINARVDPLFDQGRDFAERLRQAGVDVTHQVHAGVVHNFMEHVSFSPSARSAADDVVAALTLKC
jgi:acetyl esterase/lipase